MGVLFTVLYHVQVVSARLPYPRLPYQHSLLNGHLDDKAMQVRCDCYGLLELLGCWLCARIADELPSASLMAVTELCELCCCCRYRLATQSVHWMDRERHK